MSEFLPQCPSMRLLLPLISLEVLPQYPSMRLNGRNLQVQVSRLCAFANHNQELWEKFDAESDKNGNVDLRNKFFVSLLSQDLKNLNHKYS